MDRPLLFGSITMLSEPASDIFDARGQRRRRRDAAVRMLAVAGLDARLVVEIGREDLSDPDLYSDDAPLSRVADNVLLRVAPFGLSGDVMEACASILREMGFDVVFGQANA